MVMILKNYQRKYRRDSSSTESATNNHLLEKKITEMQTELTELYRRRGEVAIFFIH